MQPNNQQNYWQPQDEADAPRPQVPPAQNQASATDTTQSATPPPTDAVAETSVTEPTEISWQASETIEHTRGPLWYTAFVAIVLIILAATIWFQEWIFSALVVVVAITIVIMARRPPRIFNYTLNDRGLKIDNQMHDFSEFRAFGVVSDEAFFAIKLIPVKRFAPETMVYFSEKDGETIVDILATHLPMEDMELDLADRIIRKMRL